MRFNILLVLFSFIHLTVDAGMRPSKTFFHGYSDSLSRMETGNNRSSSIFEVSLHSKSRTNAERLTTLGIDVGPKNICQETNIYFVATGIDETLAPYQKVMWDMGDGQTFTNPNTNTGPPSNPPDNRWMNSPNFNYKTAGTFTVTLTVYPNPSSASPTPKSTTIVVTVYPKPAPPAGATSIDFCQGAARPLDVTPSVPTNTIIWYVNSPSGWSEYSGPAPGPTPTSTTVGSQEFRVAQKSDKGCESNWRLHTVNILTTPTPPIVNSPVSLCQDIPAVALTSTVTVPGGMEARWYNTNDPAETPLPSPPTPGTTTTDIPGRQYFVSLNSLIGCGESSRTPVDIVVNPTPALPNATFTTVDICQNATTAALPSLTAITGHTLRWWGTNPTGGTPLNTPPVPNTGVVAATSYFVSQRNNTTGCESNRLELKLVVHPLPSAGLSIPGQTVGTPFKVCELGTEPMVMFTATGGTSGYSFNYKIDGTAAPVLTTTGNTGALTVPTGSPRSVRYQLISVKDSWGCEGSITNPYVDVEVIPQPKATITGTTGICQFATSGSLVITGLDGLAPYTFTYEVTRGGVTTTQTSPAVSPTHTIVPPTDMTGTVSYRITRVEYANGVTCARDLGSMPVPIPGTFHDVNVQAAPPAPVTATPNTSFCLGNTTATLPSVNALPGHSLKWYGQNSTGGTSSPTAPAPATSIAGNYSYFVSQLENALGCESNRLKLDVTIHALPTAMMTSPGSTGGLVEICQNAPAVTLTLTGSVGPAPYRFTYRINGGNNTLINSSGTGTDASIPIATAQAGTFQYQLVSIEDGRGCSQPQNQSLSFQVKSLPDAQIRGNANVCLGTTSPMVEFEGSSGAAPYTFTYEINGGTDQTIATLPGQNTVSVAAPTGTVGLYTYRLKNVSYKNGITCSKALSAEVAIRILELPTASLNASAPLIERCQSDPAPPFTLEGSNGLAPYTFEYSLNGTVRKVNGITHTENINTNITGLQLYRLLRIIDANGCSSTGTGEVSYNILPPPLVSAGPDKHLPEGESTPLEATASRGTGLTYQWSPSIFLSDPSVLNPIASPPQTTTYTLLVTTDRGCKASASMKLTVLLKPIIPNTFTPNGDGINDRWEIRNLDAYPGAVVEIYNTMGSIVFRSAGYNQPWDGTHSGRPLPAGTYYYVIHPKFGRPKTAGYVTILR
jgi:gliding motility-associated-like protein